MQDTGVESSDQEEMRIRKQIEKMNAIINPKAKIQLVGLRPNNAILDGGWL